MKTSRGLPTVSVDTTTAFPSPEKTLIVASAHFLDDQQIIRAFTANREFDKTEDVVLLAEQSLTVLLELVEGMQRDRINSDRVKDLKGEAPKA